MTKLLKFFRKLPESDGPEVHVVYTDGNIGAGKSLVQENVRRLAKEQKNVVVVELPECVDDWRSLPMPDGTKLDMLTAFTQQAAHTMHENTYAAPFQVVTIASLLKRHNELLDVVTRTVRQRANKAIDVIMILVERSFVGNRVFADMHHAAGNISGVQATAYNYFWSQVVMTQQQTLKLLGQNLGVSVHTHHVLLQCDPDVCAERVARRPRSKDTGEGGLAIDYLRELALRHEAVYKDLAQGPRTRVHHIDSEVPPMDVAQAVIMAVRQ